MKFFQIYCDINLENNMLKRLSGVGLNNPLGKGCSAFWQVAKVLSAKRSLPGRYRAALVLEKATGFLGVRKDSIYQDQERFLVHHEVCKDLLRHGILQLRVKEKASFEEWLSFLRSKRPTQKIKINMAIAPEIVRIWNPNAKGESAAFNPSGTFPILEQLPIFSSALFNLRLDVVKLPNGVVTDWLTMDSPGAVEVVPLTSDGKIILIQQSRHTAPLGWEVPAGILEKGITPQKQAAVELEQETGFSAKEITPLGNYYIFVGSSNQVMRLFLARGLTEVGQKLEEHESIFRVKAFSQEEIWKMIENGSIRDSHTMLAVQLAMRFINREKKCQA